MANTWFEKKDQRKITSNMDGNEIEINFVLVGKKQKVFKRCESHSLGVAISACGNRHRQKKFEKTKKRTNC